MLDDLGPKIESLNLVRSTDEFSRWVRRELRALIPHAVLLGTMGKLLGMGSVATHRIGVDFPLNLVEATKNAAGAIDDPSMDKWFRSGKPSFINVVDMSDRSEKISWRRTMLAYGIRGIAIAGVLDHSLKRFAVFQLGNPYEGGSFENLKVLSELSKGMADAAWRSIEVKANSFARGSACHPTFGLTVTELNIIELIAQGFSNKEIARRRGVSDSTIKTQVQRTGAKLGANRRAEIVAIAMPLLNQLPAQSMIDYEDF